MSMTPSTAPIARRDHAAARRPLVAGAARHSSGMAREASDPLTSFRLRIAAVENAAAARATRLAVARAKQGDHEALRYLYVRYADNVYNYVASICAAITRPGRHEQAVDELTDSLAHDEDAVPPSSAGSSGSPATPRSTSCVPPRDPWPTRCSKATPARKAPPATAATAWQRPGEAAGGPAEIIVLRHLGGLAPAEIAARLGRSESAVNGLHHRGRRALRAELTPARRRAFTAAA